MQHRLLDTFIHQLRAGRDATPRHDELRGLYEAAIEELSALADGLYKKTRRQSDEINASLCGPWGANRS